MYYTIQMAFSEQKLQPNIVAECSDISLLLRLVSSGFGVAIVPETLIKQQLPAAVHAFKIKDTPAAACGLNLAEGSSCLQNGAELH